MEKPNLARTTEELERLKKAGELLDQGLDSDGNPVDFWKLSDRAWRAGVEYQRSLKVPRRRNRRKYG